MIGKIIDNKFIYFACLFAISLAGFNAFLNLPVAATPPITVNEFMIETSYSGASPSFMESSITAPIENSIHDIDGIANIRSYSSTGESHIHFNFKPNVDRSELKHQIETRLSLIRDKLPKNASAPLISDDEDGTASSIIYLGVYSEEHTALEINDYVKLHIINSLSSIAGVGRILTIGNYNPAIRVHIKPYQMAKFGITTNELFDNLNDLTKRGAGGWIENSDKGYFLQIKDNNESAEALKSLVIKTIGQNTQIKLEDVADVQIDKFNTHDTTLVNGKQGLILQVLPGKNENISSVADRVNRYLLNTNEKYHADGIKIVSLIDLSSYIKKSTHAVYEALLEAILLVGAVIYLFLRSLRLLYIPIIVIPVCLLVSMNVLSFLGYSLNLMTLLAIVLSIGLVVDDAIVVLENIIRHYKSEANIHHSCVEGTKEILFAILSMTSTLVIVFLPITFVTGLTGDLLRPFAYTLSVLVVVSGLLSVTLTPTMCSTMLENINPSFLHDKFSLLDRVRILYLDMLNFIFNNIKCIVILVMLFISIGIYAFTQLKSELVPYEDYSGVNVSVVLPSNSSPAMYRNVLLEISNILGKYDFISSTFGQTYYDDSGESLYISLKPTANRAFSSDKIVNQLEHDFKNFPDARIYFGNFSLINPSANDNEIDMIISGTDSYSNISKVVADVVSKIKLLPGLTNVRSDLSDNYQSIEVDINREYANDVGVSLKDIADQLSYLYGGVQIDNELNTKDGMLPIILSLSDADRVDLKSLQTIYVRSIISGKLIPLDALVTASLIRSPLALSHYNGLHSVLVKADLMPNYSMGKNIAAIDNITNQSLPSNLQHSWSGLTEQYLNSSTNMQMILISAFILIYFMLAIQFKNLLEPLIIILTVPLTFFSAITTTYFSGGSLNIFTEVGLLTLMGLITKHGILIVDFANIELKNRKSIKEAIISAASRRFRPILMTTLAMVMGALPLIIFTGKSADGLSQIAWTIVGGLTFGTLTSMIIVPIAYYLIVSCKRISFEQHDH